MKIGCSLYKDIFAYLSEWGKALTYIFDPYILHPPFIWNLAHPPFALEVWLGHITTAPETDIPWYPLLTGPLFFLSDLYVNILFPFYLFFILGVFHFLIIFIDNVLHLLLRSGVIGCLYYVVMYFHLLKIMYCHPQKHHVYLYQDFLWIYIVYYCNLLWISLLFLSLIGILLCIQTVNIKSVLCNKFVMGCTNMFWSDLPNFIVCLFRDWGPSFMVRQTTSIYLYI